MATLFDGRRRRRMCGSRFDPPLENRSSRFENSGWWLVGVGGAKSQRSLVRSRTIPSQRQKHRTRTTKIPATTQNTHTHQRPSQQGSSPGSTPQADTNTNTHTHSRPVRSSSWFLPRLVGHFLFVEFPPTFWTPSAPTGSFARSVGASPIGADTHT